MALTASGNPRAIGEALRLIRIFHDKRSRELADDLGISASYLSEIEHGHKRPSLDLIAEYARVFRTTSSVILFFVEELDQEGGGREGMPRARHRMQAFLKALERFAPPDDG